MEGDPSGVFKGSAEHDVSIHHMPTLVNVHVPNPFHWGLDPILDVSNEGIDSYSHKGSFKVNDIFNSKESLTDTFQRHALKNDYQYKLLHSKQVLLGHTMCA